MTFFDPSIHERVDDGNFSIGDDITLVYKESGKFVWMDFYTITKIDGPWMFPEGLGIGLQTVRHAASVMSYIRIKKDKEYKLDQELDDNEDLL